MEAEFFYTAILSGLNRQGIVYAAIGTYALRKLFPHFMARYILHDADIVLSPSISNIRQFIRHMKSAGWSVRIWDMETSPEITPDVLKHKFYLRCTQGTYTLDATYECPLPFEEMLKHSSMSAEVRLAGIEHILHLKTLKGREEDIKLVTFIRAYMDDRNQGYP